MSALTAPPPEYLTFTQVAALLGYDRSALYKRKVHKDPTFPKPVKLFSDARAKYLRSEVLAWRDARREAAMECNA